MKRLLVVLVLLGAVGAGVVRHRQPAGPAPWAPVTTASDAPVSLGVDALMKDVDKLRGQVVVEGVVKAATPETKLVELIDCEEFRACGTTSCARLTLPVRWAGPSPRSRETVRATGEVKVEAGKLVFVASALDLVPKEPAK